MIDRLIEFCRTIKYAHHFVAIKLWRFIRRKTYKLVCIVKCILAKSHFAIRMNSEKSFCANMFRIHIDVATPLFDRSFYGYSSNTSSTVMVCYIFFVSTRNSVRLSIPPIDDDSPFPSLNWNLNFGTICTPFTNERCRNASIIRLFVSSIARINTLPAYARCTRCIFNYATCFPMLATVFVSVGFARAFKDMIIGITCKRTHAIWARIRRICDVCMARLSVRSTVVGVVFLTCSVVKVIARFACIWTCAIFARIRGVFDIAFFTVFATILSAVEFAYIVILVVFIVACKIANAAIACICRICFVAFVAVNSAVVGAVGLALIQVDVMIRIACVWASAAVASVRRICNITSFTVLATILRAVELALIHVYVIIWLACVRARAVVASVRRVWFVAFVAMRSAVIDIV